MENKYTDKLIEKFWVKMGDNYHDLREEINGLIDNKKVKFIFRGEAHNEIMMIGDEYSYKITMNDSKNNPISDFALPITVCEKKINIKEKKYNYKNSSTWDIEYIYNDGNSQKIVTDDLKKSYEDKDINKDLLLYLIRM